MNSDSEQFSRLSGCRTPRDLATEMRGIISGTSSTPGSKLPSIRRLSELTGLSRGEVCQALTTLRIEGLVEQRRGSGTYVSAGISSQMHTKLSQIGVILPVWDPTASHYEVGGILRGISERCSRARYRLEIVHGDGDSQRDYSFADELTKLGLHGLIWIQPSYDVPLSLPRILEKGLPLVLVGRGYPSLPIERVGWDERELATQIGDWMLRHGRKHLICMVGPRDDVTTARQIEALRAAFKARGLSLPDEQILTARMGHVEHLFSIDLNKCAVDFLESNRGFDAVYSHYPDRLGQLLRLHESGHWRCPEDFLLLHFCRTTLPDDPCWQRVPISFVELPQEVVGREAVRRLEKLWGLGEDTEPEQINPVLHDAYE